MDHREPTRTRQEGTKVVSDARGEKIIAALREIVANQQYGKVNGIMVDLYSASAIVKVFDACNETNKAKFLKLSLGRMASVSFKLLK